MKTAYELGKEFKKSRVPGDGCFPMFNNPYPEGTQDRTNWYAGYHGKPPVTEMISKQAVREAAEQGLSAVFHLLGPTDEKNEAARVRLSQIDSLDRLCDWDNFTPNTKARDARRERKCIMDIQASFESKYC